MDTPQLLSFAFMFFESIKSIVFRQELMQPLDIYIIDITQHQSSQINLPQIYFVQASRRTLLRNTSVTGKCNIISNLNCTYLLKHFRQYNWRFYYVIFPYISHCLLPPLIRVAYLLKRNSARCKLRSNNVLENIFNKYFQVIFLRFLTMVVVRLQSWQHRVQSSQYIFQICQLIPVIPVKWSCYRFDVTRRALRKY